MSAKERSTGRSGQAWKHAPVEVPQAHHILSRMGKEMIEHSRPAIVAANLLAV